MTLAVAPISAAITASLMAGPPTDEIDQPLPVVLPHRAPCLAQRVREVALQRRGGDRDAGLSEDLASVRLAFRRGEAEQHDRRRIGPGGDQQVALELAREPVAGLRPAVELEGERDRRSGRSLQMAEPIRANEGLPPLGAGALPPPQGEPVRLLARSAGVGKAGEEAG